VFIAEFIGCTRVFRGLTPKTIKSVSLNDYFSHFSNVADTPTFLLDGEENGLKNLILSNRKEMSAVKQRYNFDPRDQLKTVLFEAGAQFSNLGIGPHFTSAIIDNCYFLNQFESNVRIRHVLHVVLCSRELRKEKYAELTRLRLEHHGLTNVRSTDELLIANIGHDDNLLSEQRAQFINLFTIKDVSEPTIGAFLESNPLILQKAFSIKTFFHEKELQWIEGNSNPSETGIKPDFFLKRADGYCDIMDLKKPRWDVENLTKGGHKRRRFVDYVNEGIAQLANYEDYFKFPLNQSHASEKYGIAVNQPNLYLIVGNYENLPTSEKLEALRSQKKNLTILDYETINALASI
jgi:hypothetical protein